MVKVLVQSQGMQLVLQACPYVRTHPGTLQQVLDVRVRVVDSETAAHFVRGPLADGEEVDMGDVHLGFARGGGGPGARCGPRCAIQPGLAGRGDARAWLAGSAWALVGVRACALQKIRRVAQARGDLPDSLLVSL